jgi:surfeit locus 1 family protein
MRRVAFILVMGVAGLAVLIALGTWQVRRLAWKEGILAAMSARMSDPLSSLPAVPEEERDEYRALRLTGRIGEGEVHVLTSQRPEGPGFLVIAPLILPDGRRILIERGYVPEAAKAAPRGRPDVAIAANLLWPDDATAWTPEPDTGRNIWFARDPAAMARALGTEPVLAVARDATGDGIRPVPVSVDIPNDHLGYAITWFGLAAVWAAMTGWFLIARPRA